MIAALAVPPWMIWTALILSVLAGIALLVGWRRGRVRHPKINGQITIRPLSADFGSSPGRAKGSSLKLPKLMPPPGPIAPPLNDTKAEHRATFRRVGNAVLIMVADANGHHRPLNAWVIDRSRQGLRLAAETELRIGEVYTVRPTQAPPATPWSEVEIRNCVQTDSHWEIGCRFLKMPPLQTLMLFG